MDKNVNIYFKVEGLDGYITNLEDLRSALSGVEKATEAANEATEQLTEAADNAEALEGAVKTLAGSFQILAGAASLLGVEDNEFFKSLEENVMGVIALSQGAIDAAEGFNKLRKWLNESKKAQAALNAVANANPYVLLATAIIALTTAIVAYKLASEEAEWVEKRRAEDAQKAAEDRLKVIDQTEETLKRQGLSEEDITDEKVAQLQLVVQNAKIRASERAKEKQADIDRKTSYKEGLSAMLQFLLLPLAAVLKTIDDISKIGVKLGLIEEATNLRAGLFEGIAGLIFNPDKAREEADAEIAIIEEQGRQAQNVIDRIFNTRKKQREDAARETREAEERLQDELNRRQLQRELDSLEDRARELREAQEANDKLVEEAKGNADLLAQIQEDYRLTVLGINQKYDAIDLQNLQDAQDFAYQMSLSSKEREELALMQAADAQVMMLDQALADELITEQQHADAVYKINQQLADDLNKLWEDQSEEQTETVKASTTEIVAASLEAASTLASALQNLSDVNTEERLKNVEKGSEAEERILREQFERNKKFQIAQAIISTAQSVMQALSSSPPPASYILAAANAAAGALQIAAIKKTTFDGGSQSSFNAPNPATSINYSFGQDAGPTIGLGQNSLGQQMAPVQTYVLASDVTNAQQAQQQIQNLSRL